MVRNTIWWNEGIKVEHLLSHHLLALPSLSEGDAGDELDGAVDPLPVVNIIFIKEEGVISPGEEHQIEKVQLNLTRNYDNPILSSLRLTILIVMISPITARLEDKARNLY